jgi:pimeloyl-ACP methyl ester carboxylesterase
MLGTNLDFQLSTTNLPLYFISGLGADRHAFDRIKLPEHFFINYIDWLEPEKNEAIEHYAKRMAANIDISKPFVLVGLSFGGIISVEISKLFPAQKVVLISSIATHTQLPWYLRLVGNLQLHKLGFVYLFKNVDFMMNYVFGVHTPKMKAYLKEMIEKTTSNYLVWSLDTILKWRNSTKPANTVQINGKMDKLFQIKDCQPEYVINRGSHFMILTHAHEISLIIEKELS